MKAVKEKLKPEEVAAFEKGAQAYAKKIVANFKDYEFVRLAPPLLSHIYLTIEQYTGESMNPEGQVALLNYREDGVTRESRARGVVCADLTCHSLLYFLEARSKGDQALDVELFVELKRCMLICVQHARCMYQPLGRTMTLLDSGASAPLASSHPFPEDSEVMADFDRDFVNESSVCSTTPAIVANKAFHVQRHGELSACTFQR
jgi:hypothetical protein